VTHGPLAVGQVRATYNVSMVATNKEAAMTQSMIGFGVALVALLISEFMVAQRYRREHPTGGMPRWLDVHHINWVTRKLDVDPKNDDLP